MVVAKPNFGTVLKNVNVYSEMPLPLVDMQVPQILSFVSNYTEGIFDRPSGLWYQYGIIRGPLYGYCSRSSNPYHYGDVIIGAMASQPFIQMQIKKNVKAPRHWPLCGEFTGDR